jgi:hypothetical protein
MIEAPNPAATWGVVADPVANDALGILVRAAVGFAFAITLIHLRRFPLSNRNAAGNTLAAEFSLSTVPF